MEKDTGLYEEVSAEVESAIFLAKKGAEEKVKTYQKNNRRKIES